MQSRQLPVDISERYDIAIYYSEVAYACTSDKLCRSPPLLRPTLLLAPVRFAIFVSLLL